MLLNRRPPKIHFNNKYEEEIYCLMTEAVKSPQTYECMIRLAFRYIGCGAALHAPDKPSRNWRVPVPIHGEMQLSYEAYKKVIDQSVAVGGKPAERFIADYVAAFFLTFKNHWEAAFLKARGQS